MTQAAEALQVDGPTCGQMLVRLLEDFGIEMVFGIPGVHTIELYRGLPEARLRHVTPRHEQGAGFMADGYARAGGRPAACFVITGPGVTNIATAVGQAYSDSVPMLVISSVNATSELGRGEGRLHELPSQRGLMSGLTAFSHTVADPRELPHVLARAFDVFASARPRPVHIELPVDVIAAPAPLLQNFQYRAALRPCADRGDIARAAAMLCAARRPFVVLGGGCNDAAGAARALVERLGAPAVMTIHAKGVLPRGHPLALAGMMPQTALLEYLAEADVVLAIGTELSETDTLLFGRRLELKGQVIRIDIDARQIDRNARAAIGIVSDARSALESLYEEISGFVPDSQAVARTRAMREKLYSTLGPQQRAHQRFMAAIEAALPDAIVVGDSTQPVYSANLFHESDTPRRYFNSTTGYGTLGYALPAALGAKLARPALSVVAIVGDGGLQFTVGELATAAEVALPVPIIVWNNRGYGEIKDCMVAHAVEPLGVDIGTPDFQALARGFGCRAARADSLTHLRVLLREAIAANGPTLIDVDEASALQWQR